MAEVAKKSGPKDAVTSTFAIDNERKAVDMSVQLMQKYAEDLEKSGVGYDQGNRWSFNPARDGKNIVPNQECDCSSSTAAIIRAGGYDLDTRDPIYTGNFYEKAKAAGKYAHGKGGRKKSVDRTKVRALREQGVSFRKIAEQLGCSLSSVQRVIYGEAQ